MEKKIIFDLPEEVSIAKIILDIFKKFGVTDDTLSPNSGLVLTNSATKDFFAKKITENDFLELLQKKLGTTKENAVGIMNDLKEQLISFGKEVIIPTDEEDVGRKEIIKTPGYIKPTLTSNKNILQTAEIKVKNKETSAPKKFSDKNTINENFINSAPKPTRPKGPDKYHEPIE